MRIACKEEGFEILRASLDGYVGSQEQHIDLLSVRHVMQFLKFEYFLQQGFL